MQGARTAHAVARWTLLLLGILAAAACWVALCGWATGDATSAPTLQGHRTEASSCYAAALLAVGVASSLAVRARRLTRASLLLGGVAVLLLATPRVRELWAEDACLDHGGRWNPPAFACEK